MKKTIIILLLFALSCGEGIYAQRRGNSANAQTANAQAPKAQTPTAQSTEKQEVSTEKDRKKVSRRGRVNKWIYEADKAYKDERYFKALGYYDRAYNRAPEGPVRKQLRVKLGQTQRKLNHPVEAVVFFDREWTDGNRNNEFLADYADVLLRTARYDMAENIYVMLLKIDSNNVNYKNRLASARLGKEYSDTINILDDEQILTQERISTAFSEYGMIIANGKLIFSSAQRTVPATTDYRTGEGFSHIYSAQLAPDTMLWERPIPLSSNIWHATVNDGVFTYDPENKMGYFQRCNQGNCGIYTTTLDENGEWTIPQKFVMNGVAAPENVVVGHPAISPDGKRLIFTTKAEGGEGGTDLWMTSKVDKEAVVETPRRRSGRSNNQRVAQSSRASKAATQQTEKNQAAPPRPGTRSRNASKTPPVVINNADWTAPVNLGKAVNTVGDEVFPIWINNHAIAFSSNGHVGYGGLDLYVAIADSQYNFIERIHIAPPINSSFDDYTLVISPELERIFFSSSRYQGLGHSDEVFSFPKTATILDLQFDVTDAKTGEQLASTTISICGDADTCVTFATDSIGRARYARSKESKNYNMGFAKEGYYSQEHNIENLNDALDIIPMRDVRRITIAMVPDTSAKIEFAPTPAEWTFFAENAQDDTMDLVALASLDTLVKLHAPESPCGRMIITLNESPYYTQIGEAQSVETPFVDTILVARMDTLVPDSIVGYDTCYRQYHTSSSFYNVPFTADSVSDFAVTGFVSYVADRPDSLFVFDSVPFIVQVKGANPPMPVEVAPAPADTMPLVQWFPDVERTEEDKEHATLVAKAVIKTSYEMASEKTQELPFAPIMFRFQEAPENYDLIEGIVADKIPLRRVVPFTIDSITQDVPLSYYMDTITYRQKIKINNPAGFQIPAQTDYMIGKDSDFSLYPNVDMLFPIEGEVPREPAVIWYTSVVQSEDGTVAELIAKAEINPNALMFSEQIVEEGLRPVTFAFFPDAENYNKEGNIRPQETPKTIASIASAPFGLDTMSSIIGAVTYYTDSAVYIQRANIVSTSDFTIRAEVNFMTGSQRGLEDFPQTPLLFHIKGVDSATPEEAFDDDIAWGAEFLEEEPPVVVEEEDTTAPVFNNKLAVKESTVQDLSDCMQPGMTPEEITDCLNRTKKDEEVVDLRTTETYRERINDPNRRANMAILPKNVPCKDCDKEAQRHELSKELYVQSGDDKKVLKLTDQAGNTTYMDLAPNTKYHINVASAVTELAANLPDNVQMSDLVKTATTKDYVVYECLPKLNELGDETYVNNIYYDFDKSDIIRDGHRELDRMIIIAIKNPHLKFEVTAHADERGTQDYNVALTERRLAAVTEYIRKKGLDMGRLITKAVGKSDPLIKNATNDDEHALNRRTTIRLYDPNATNQLKGQTDYEATESNPLARKGLWFRVQLGAFRAAPEYPLYLFKDYLDAVPDMKLNYYQDRDGLYKFTLGDFNNLEQARKLNQRILDADKEAYIVVFMDGQRITVSEAQAILKRQARK